MHDRTKTLRNDDWGVDPNVTKYQIFGDSGWVEFKNELTVGEQKQIDAAVLKNMQVGADMEAIEGDRLLGLDLKKQAIEKLFVWLAGWSRTDKSGSTIEITRGAVASLRAGVFEAIEQQLDLHIKKVRADVTDTAVDAKNAESSSTS